MRTNIFKLFLGLLMLLLTMGACYEDKSTYNTELIGNIIIDTTQLPRRIFAKYGQVLKLDVTVTKESSPNAEFDFLWRISTGTYDTTRIVIGREEDLSARIMVKPSDFDYTLSLTVTDKANGLQSFIQWPINVTSPLGNGLLVMDSNGNTSDLHFIMANEFSANVATELTIKPTVYHNLYSKTNGEGIPGVACGLHYNKGPQTFLAVTCVTDRSIVRVDPQMEYTVMDRDGGVFFVAPSVIAPTGICGGPDKAALVNEGKVCMHSGQNDTRYMSAFSGDYQVKQHIALHSDFSWAYCGASGAVFDEKNKRFMLIPTITGMGAPMMVFKTNNGGVFDPNNPGELTCLYAGLSLERHWGFVMKERNADKYFVYEINGKSRDTGSSGKRKIDISHAPEISESSSFTFSTIEDILYYTGKNKLYAIQLASNGTTVITCCDLQELNASSNEEITMLNLYRGPGFIKLDGQITKSTYRILIIGSYDETTKSGALYSLPIRGLNSGQLDKTQMKRFDGFGKVLAASMQGMEPI